MQRIITAVFDKRMPLDAAIAELEQNGFSRDAIHLGTGDPAGADSPLGTDEADPVPNSGVGKVLQTLFGSDNSEFAQRIDGAVTHGHLVLHLVAVQADVGRASAIIGRHVPVSIETSGGAAPAPAGLSQLAAEPPGGSHEASWRAHHAARHGTPHGGMDPETGAAAIKAIEQATAYPGDEHYDEYAPAYLYGLDMATHEQHGGKEWEEAEAALKHEWEQRHPASAWARFKEAVRHAWERIRSENAGR